MKKIAILSVMLAMTILPANAKIKIEKVDSINTYQLQSVQVTSTRVNKKTPIAFKNLDLQQIKAVNFGQDIPYILSFTPSVTTTSDAGNGIGYTSMRIRGIDPSRISMTSNGIPMNDAESSQVYFVNIGDFTSSIQNLQIQRGIGSSTNGAGAFGATVNMQTEDIGVKPYLGLDLSGGSYYSHKETLRFSTGLLGNHWGIQGRLSNIGSHGYIDRAHTKLNSYFLQAGYFDENTMIKFITFNGNEQTYHAWNYTSKYEQGLYGRTYNSCGVYYDDNKKMQYYQDQTDNYHQQHYQLIWDQILNKEFNLNFALHYTKGHGYYDEYKSNKDLRDYGLSTEKYKTDLTRMKNMDNDFYGGIMSFNYDNHKNITATLGGGWNRYDGDHYGNVKWVKNPVTVFYPGYEYYHNNALKSDFNVYGKVNYEFIHGLNGYVDLQYRHVGYRMQDPTDTYGYNLNGAYIIHDDFDFFNPKFGFSFNVDRHNEIYVSYAISHREPTRNDYQDNGVTNLKAESLRDLEFGYKYQSKTFSAGVNFYYMNYRNQYVLTGKLNDIGEMIASNDNSGKSYREGIEIEAAWKPASWFKWDVNSTLSHNMNKDWIITTESNENVNIGDTHTAFSPDFIFNNIFTFLYKGFNASIQSQYIGEQYLTNSNFKTMRCNDKDGNTTWETIMLDSHFTTNLNLAYNFNLKKAGIKSATIGITLYNIFNAKYDNNGWAAPQYIKKNGSIIAVNTWNIQDMDAAGFAPSAPFNWMVHLSVNF